MVVLDGLSGGGCPLFVRANLVGGCDGLVVPLRLGSRLGGCDGLVAPSSLVVDACYRLGGCDDLVAPSKLVVDVRYL